MPTPTAHALLRPTNSMPTPTASIGRPKDGKYSITRGEIRWYTYRQPDKRRPVLLLTRDEVIDAVNEIVVAPATRTIRGLSSEVELGIEDGMPTDCVVNFDHVALAQRSKLGPALTTLPSHRWPEVRGALLCALGFEDE